MMTRAYFWGLVVVSSCHTKFSVLGPHAVDEGSTHAEQLPDCCSVQLPTLPEALSRAAATLPHSNC